MSDRPSTMPLATISSINAPDTYENHLEILDTDDEEPKGVDRETSVIPVMASTLQKAPQVKTNAEGVPTLLKKQQSTPSSYHLTYLNYRS